MTAFLDDEWFWAMMQFFSVTASLLYLGRQVHAQRVATMLVTLESLSGDWWSAGLREARRQLCEEYRAGGGDTAAEMSPAGHVVASWLNHLGGRVEMGVLAIEPVWSDYSNYVENYWTLLRPGIEGYRTETRDSTWFRSFERLYPIIRRASWRLGMKGWLRRQLCSFWLTPRKPDEELKAELDRFIVEELAQVGPKPPALSATPASAGAPSGPEPPPSEVLRLIASWMEAREGVREDAGGSRVPDPESTSEDADPGLATEETAAAGS